MRRDVRLRAAWGVATLALGGFLVFEAATHGGAVAWAAVGGVLAPDLAFLAAIGGGPHHPAALPARAVRPYNLTHHWLPPLVVLAVTAFWPGSPAAFVAALGWLMHGALDRALGLAPRRTDGTSVWGPAIGSATYGPQRRFRA